MKLYTYEQENNVAGSKVKFLLGIKENRITNIFGNLVFIFHWFSIGFLFYLNSTYIHSKLFALFIFLMGIVLMFTLRTKEKLSTKEEFLKKVNEILGESDND